MIQNYAIGKIIKPVVVGLILYISFFFILDLGIAGNIIYGLFGLILFITTALLSGVLRTLNHLNNDLNAIFTYSINTFEHAINDITKVSTKVNNITNNQNSLNLLFEGFIYTVVAPVVLKKVAGIPIIEKLVNTGVSYGCDQVINLFIKQNIQLNINSSNTTNKVLSFANNQHKNFEILINNTNNAINKSINTIKFPFKIGFYGMTGILFIFISILYIL